MLNYAALVNRLTPPASLCDVILDTDTYNEIDDQYALAYLIRSTEKLRLQAVYAAPFFNDRSSSPADGMEKSYEEILRLFELANVKHYQPQARAFRGSTAYLPDEKTPVVSDAARDLAERALKYSPEKPLYVAAIAAITNIASAILLEPKIVDRVVLVWLGGHSWDWSNTDEFNMRQDVAAARVIFNSGLAVVQLPCMGVVSAFYSTKPELEYFLRGKNKLCDYLLDITFQYMNDRPGIVWSKVIWDVTAPAWLVGGMEEDRLEAAPLPQYDHHYSFDHTRHPIRYVYHIHRDKLFADLFAKLAQ
jgi:inosine-uridine nucleoside N-ribohydrolase